MPIEPLSAIINILRTFLDIVDRKSAKEIKITKALVSIQIAIMETRKNINEVGYKPNIDLSKLWLDAFTNIRMTNIYPDNDFPEYLYNKARFWSDPQAWLKEPGSMELIPKLKKLEEECALILVELNKK